MCTKIFAICSDGFVGGSKFKSHQGQEFTYPKKGKKIAICPNYNFQTTQFNKASITTTTWGHLQINFVFMDSI